MTDEELVTRAMTQAKLNGAILCGVLSWEGSRRTEHVPLLTVDYDALSSAVVAALREAGRLVADARTVTCSHTDIHRPCSCGATDWVSEFDGYEHWTCRECGKSWLFQLFATEEPQP